jgi:predicted alpha-1,6-mannanase (GH76 family)
MMKKILLLISLLGLFRAASADISAGKTYRIVSAADETRSLFVKNASFDNAAPVVIWTETNVPAQEWEVVANTGGTYSFRNVYTGKYLGRSTALADSTRACQNTNNLSMSKWTVTAVEGGYTLSMATSTSTYYLENYKSEDGILPAFLPKKDTGSAQVWKLVEVDAQTAFDRADRARMMTGWLTQFLRTRGTNQQSLGSGGGWGDAEMMETLLDAYETSGTEAYLTAFKNVFNFFITNVGSNWEKSVYNDTYKWFGNDFNDDVMWMILASIRAYQMTGTITYRTYAKNNFDAIYTRALNQWGMLRWAEQSGGKNGTNSCINGPAEVAACYIAMATGDESYYAKARSLYENQRRYLFNANTGQVYDSFTWDATTNLPGGYNNWASTYNQGTMLGAAVLLYNHYGDELYKQDAEKIMDYTVKNMCNADGVIKVCQTVTGDLCGFKGILMRYARKFIVDLRETQYVDWMQKNAARAFNNMNSKDVASSAWLTKSTENFKFGTDDYSGQAFGCSTPVSAAFNAPLDVNKIIKDAYATIEAEDFNYLHGIYVTDGTAGDNALEISNIGNGRYVCYSNVDFGSRPATTAEFRVSALANTAATCNIYICLDSIDGTCIGTATVPNTDGWKVVTTTVAPTEGMHNVYLRFGSNKTTPDLFRFDYFKFGTSHQAMTGDITDNGGKLSAVETADNLPQLTDNRLTTYASVAASSATFAYQSPQSVLLKGYTVASSTADATTDPTSWELQASADGSTWTTLDTQTGITFDARAQVRSFAVATTQEYAYFRLVVKANGGAASLNVGEWQLFGRCLFTSDITADGGTLTPSDATSLIDKNAETTVSADASSAVTYSYGAKGNYVPSRYSITSTATGGDSNPVSWTLYGSTDNSTWTALDTQTGQTFAYGSSSQFYGLNTDVAYRYFKLVVDGNGGATQTEMAEWQVFGETAASAILYNDITKNQGTLTASDGAGESALTALVDANAATTYTLPFDTQAWVQYQSILPVQLKGFSVTAGYDADRNPATIRLQASNDGQTWTTLTTRSLTFSTRGQVQSATLSTTATYTYFRLLVSKLSNTASTSCVIGDFQLHGICLGSNLITGDGTKTAEYAGTKDTENYTMIFDSSADTKYCTDFYASSWFQYQAPTAQKANLYSLSSANDDATRDPKSWTLSGSDDGSSWTVLDTRSNQSFFGRKVTQFYPFANDKAYTYYRLKVTGNQGASLIQFSDWQLFYSDKAATGIKTVNDDTAITVGPNPVVDNLSVTVPGAAQVAIYGANGQLVSRSRVVAGTTTLPFGGFAPGLYLVKVNAGSSTKTFKIIK